MRPEACAAAGEALPVETTTPTPETTVREGMMEGALHVVGERGYRDASVRAVLEFSGGYKRQFYQHFESLEACFQEAYAVWIERLGISLLEAAVLAPGWQEGVRAGLVRLFQFVSRRPAIARSLFVEVHVAGGAALGIHEEVTERLAQAIDSVRDGLDPAQAPPQSAAIFVVGGIEACLCDALAAGDQSRIWDALPELMHLAVGSYRGREAADEEFEKTKGLLKRDRAQLGGESR
jgi:AcrR family transcriptional regulator